MTIKQTLKAIRAMGLSAGYVTLTREFRVSYPGRPETDYFTDCREDALATALNMAARAGTCTLGAFRAAFSLAMSQIEGA